MITTRRTLLLSALACVPSLTPAGWWGTPDWPSVKRDIRKQYPQVVQMGVAELRVALSQPAPPMLLDVRSAPEYAVSHLRNAQWAPDWQHASGLLKNQAKNQPIVVYCAVGWRSSSLAQELMDQGYTQVRNLEGSLFEWANHGLPVYSGDKLVQQVHPFDRRWGSLLNQNLHANMP